MAETGLSGAVNWRESYAAYGEKRLDPVGNRDDEGFTGHIDDAATGLTYMQARYYDPVIGRFLSNDPVGFAPTRPQYFNRYSYSGNDPVNNLDPDGEFWMAVGAVISGGIQAYSEIKSGSFSDGAFSKQGLQALGRIGVSAGAGALGGGLGSAVARGVGGATLGGAIARTGVNGVGGATIGATQVTSNAALEGRLPTQAELASGAITGAALTAGGTAAGELLEAGGRAIGGAARSSAEDTAMVERMVQGGELPGGMPAPDLPSGPGPHPASAAGATAGNLFANSISNAGPLIDDEEDG